MNYKAIIFDMDGTIIDTNHIWEQATRDVLTTRGVILHPDIEIELSSRLAGLGLNESCAILKEIGKLDDLVHDLVREKSSRAVAMYAQDVRFIQGFTDFHAQLDAKNLKYGVATNADDDTIHITNKKLNLNQFFGEHLYGISHVANIGKPHPGIYLHAAKKLEIDPRHCIAIEDSAHGIEAAQKAGMFCIGINTSKNMDQVRKADMIIDGYHEIDLEKLLGLKK